MIDDDRFRPRLGKTNTSRHATGSSKKYAHQLRAAINRAGGKVARKSNFTGSRIGRGRGMGAWLASRNQQAFQHHRRVIVKARIVKLAGKGMERAVAHLNYVQRDGVTREGDKGQLYGPDHDQMDGKEFLERADGDRHQFRFIVAPEDSIEYDDLKPLTRRLMAQMEKDLDTRLDWVAVDHFNTGHPHTHIIVRGKDETGHDLVLARNYLTVGIRERAAELVSLDLGPRSEYDIETQLRTEMTAERLTGLDRQLLRMEKEGGDLGINLSSLVQDPFRQTLLAGRLKHLERHGLADERYRGHWYLEPGLEDTLRRMGERGDIIKTMHRAMSKQEITHSPADYVIHGSSADIKNASMPPMTEPLTGRVVARGLSDELGDTHYLIVDGTDGRAHFMDIGRGDATEPTPVGSIVRVTPWYTEPRKADRTIAEVAAANGGRYNIDLHLRYDQRATETFAETHVRRLEAIRRMTGGVNREPNGTWIITSDHLDRARQYELAQAKQMPFVVEKLSNLSIDQQINADGATWLDRNLISGHSEPNRTTGFGRELHDAMNRRRQWLVEQGLAEVDQGYITYRGNMLATLQRRELNRVAGKLSDQTGLAYIPPQFGDCIEGRLSRTLELASGKFAVVEMSQEFTLVPWRPVLEHHIGQEISGIVRESGISWTIGRQRGLGR